MTDSVCFFTLRPFQFPNHLSWKEPILGSFLLLQTTKASPGDQTHSRKVTGLDIIDSNHRGGDRLAVTLFMAQTVKFLT